jgi:ABC-type phosphate transport system substrate-binding protein
MKKHLIIFFVALGALVLAAHAQGQVIVIANPGVKATEISKGELHDVFTGDATTLKDGTRVVPIILKAGTVHEEFLQAYVGKSDAAYRTGWRSLVFSGQASMPKSLDTDSAVVEFVKNNAGTIGYVGKATPHEGVKVLTIK